MEELKFDEALMQLETVIRRLEAGNMPLEEAIDAYKAGMNLSTLCHNKLQAIEEEVVKLVDAQGQVTDFSESGE